LLLLLKLWLRLLLVLGEYRNDFGPGINYYPYGPLVVVRLLLLRLWLRLLLVLGQYRNDFGPGINYYPYGPLLVVTGDTR
jgi:hypothetical protein